MHNGLRAGKTCSYTSYAPVKSSSFSILSLRDSLRLAIDTFLQNSGGRCAVRSPPYHGHSHHNQICTDKYRQWAANKTKPLQLNVA